MQIHSEQIIFSKLSKTVQTVQPLMIKCSTYYQSAVNPFYYTSSTKAFVNVDVYCVFSFGKPALQAYIIKT